MKSWLSEPNHVIRRDHSRHRFFARTSPNGGLNPGCGLWGVREAEGRQPGRRPEMPAPPQPPVLRMRPVHRQTLQRRLESSGKGTRTPYGESCRFGAAPARERGLWSLGKADGRLSWRGGRGP